MARTRSRVSKSGENSPITPSKGHKPSSANKGNSKKGAASKSENNSSHDSVLFSDGVAVKAIEQLTQFLDREEQSISNDKSKLFDDSEEKRNLFVQVNTKKFYADKPNFKPLMIQLPHPFLDSSSDLKTCLFVRDNLIKENEQVESIEEAKLPTLSEIIPLKSLKEEYNNFEKRRFLKSQYDLFLVDDALLNLMPTVLGKIFYSGTAQKVPLPVKVTSSSKPGQLSIETLKNLITRCLNSTSFLPPVGINITIKIGVLSQPDQQEEQHLIQNLHKVISHFDRHNIKSIMIKTNHSPSLPIYYTKTLYDEREASSRDDKNDSVAKPQNLEDKKPRLSSFEASLAELGHEEDVTKVLGKKLKKQKKSGGKKSQKKSKDGKA